MIRREFLQRGLTTVAGAGIAYGLPGFTLASPAFSVSSRSGTFSLDIIADRSAGMVRDVVNDVGSFLTDNRLSSGIVKVRTANLAGEHIVDAALVRDGRLIDFRSTDGHVEDFLGDLSNRYGFLRGVEDPTLIRFSGGDGSRSSRATEAQVFVGDLLVAQRSLHLASQGDVGGSTDDGAFEETVRSEHGSLTVRYDQEGVRVLDATCKHKTCVKAGTVSMSGASLVCIPSRIRVVLVGGADAEVNAVSQ